jgi:hypothetical protein
MPRNRVRIDVTGLDEWIDELANFEVRDPAALDAWRHGVERFYDATQRHVHVLDGPLKASGRYDTQRLGRDQLEGAITYGGTPDVDYAVYEFARGGNHDALQRGYEDSYEALRRAVLEAVDAEIDSWG